MNFSTRVVPCQVKRYARPVDAFSRDLLGTYPCPAGWAGFPASVQSQEEIGEYLTNELNNGWAAGARLIDEAFGQVMAKIPEISRRKITHGHMFGFNPDISALYDGRPDAFSQIERKAAPKAIRVVCDVSVSGGVNESALVWSGAVAVALVNAIEASGNRAEVWVSNFGSGAVGGPSHCCDLVCVKEASQALLPDMLASVLASPRYYRAALVRRDCEWTQSRSGKNPGQITKAQLEAIAPDLDNSVLVPRVFRLNDAVRLLAEKLEEVESQ